MTRAIVVVWNRAPDHVDGHMVPDVPAGWDLQCDDGRCIVIWPRGREERPHLFLRCKVVAATALKVALLVHGPDAILEAVLAATPLAWTLSELRALGTAAATQIKAAWIDDRPRDENGDPIGPLVAMSGGYADQAAGLNMAADAEATTSLPGG